MGNKMRPLDELYRLKCEADRRYKASRGNAVVLARVKALNEAIALVNQFLEQQLHEEK